MAVRGFGDGRRWTRGFGDELADSGGARPALERKEHGQRRPEGRGPDGGSCRYPWAVGGEKEDAVAREKGNCGCGGEVW